MESTPAAVQAAVTALHEAIAALETPLPLVWHRCHPRGPHVEGARPRLAREAAPWTGERWRTLRANEANWFRAEVRFPAEVAGIPLAGAEAWIFVNNYLPFTLWIDGEEQYREAHDWHATGPIADPLAQPITPGACRTLELCAAPTAVDYRMNPVAVCVRARPCVEAATDLHAAAAQLEFAARLAATPDDITTLEGAAAAIDLTALRRRRWPAITASLARLDAALAPFAARARAHTLHLIGHTHIDLDWRWTWADTVHCARRDFASTVDLLRDYPDLRFSLSQIPLYQIVQEQDPDVFAAVLALIRAGRWENLAATWVEGDLNMADGEALVRHARYAAEWSEANLGERARTLWEPDTFGHPGNMPQIATLAGCDTYFHWRCNPGAEANWPIRLWQGVDGTEILAVSSAYGGGLTPGLEMYQALHNLFRYLSFGLTQAHHVWGSGDHGGGLQRHHLALLARYRDKPVMPTIRFSTLRDFRAAALQERDRFPRNCGESFLLFEGCFTTHGDIKRWNRRAEGALLTAEALAARAGLECADDLRAAWLPVLFNQFHDIFDGAAVRESYADACRRAAASVATAERLTADAVAALLPAASGVPETLALFNPLGHARREITRISALPDGITALRTADGERLAVQRDGAEWVFRSPEVPAFGHAVLHLERTPGPRPQDVSVRDEGPWFYIATPGGQYRLNKESGAVVSCVDPRLGRDLVGYGTPKHLSHVHTTRTDLALNVFHLIREAANPMSAWLIHDHLREEFLLRGARVRLVAAGPVFARVDITHRFGRSRLTESVYFYRESPVIEFRGRLDWRETGSPTAGIPQLKLSFAAALAGVRVRSEGPFVVTERPADGQEQVTQKWAAVCGDDAGFAVYNDGQYGFDALGSRLRVTLVRNAYTPDPDSDGGAHTFRLGFEPLPGETASPTLVRRGQAFNRPLVAVLGATAADRGTPFIESEGGEAVVCTALCRSARSGELLLRWFEAAGRPARLRIRVAGGLTAAETVNFLEESIGDPVRVVAGWAELDFHPWEIKTLRIPCPL
jgi:alpha-mannosidase